MTSLHTLAPAVADETLVTGAKPETIRPLLHGNTSADRATGELQNCTARV
jgi:hypothetical protein